MLPTRTSVPRVGAFIMLGSVQVVVGGAAVVVGLGAAVVVVVVALDADAGNDELSMICFGDHSPSQPLLLIARTSKV